MVLANRKISDVIEDLEGNIWCTTLNDGIHQILSKELLCYTPETIQRNATISCIEIIDKGEVLLGTSNGIVEIIKNESTFMAIDGEHKAKITKEEVYLQFSNF